MSSQEDSMIELNFGRKCADPFKMHKKIVRNGLRPVKQEDIDTPGLTQMVIGMKICVNCQKKLQEKRSEEQSRDNSTSGSEASSGEEVKPGPSSSCEVRILPEQSEEVSKGL